jgi:8-hydroxy-5-deazaflavin:NADPH oxidoreductase
MKQTIAILGGTGAEGSGLGLRWAAAGYPVVIGSRQAERAEAAAATLCEKLGGNVTIEGLANADAAARAEIAVLTVPFAAQADTLKSVKDALRPDGILVDCTVPLAVAVGGRATRVLGVPQGSAAQQAAELAPKGMRVVSAFHHVGAESLMDLDKPLHTDVLVCGDDRAAKSIVRELVEAIPGARYVDAGPLESSRIVESLTALLVGINIRYKVRSSGVRIEGLDGEG